MRHTEPRKSTVQSIMTIIRLTKPITPKIVSMASPAMMAFIFATTRTVAANTRLMETTTRVS